MQVFIVEDEGKIANILRKGLLMDFYNVDIARNGEEALEKMSYNSYDFIILDVMLPKIDGLTVCREIRKKNTIVPILILTAKDDINDKIAGLDAGADDYVTKPFSYAEISARIRALLRRGNKADPVILTIADITLNPATKMVIRNKHMISLTAREFALLEYLMRNQNIVLTKSQILEHVWDYQYEGLSNIVETYVKYLRKKLKISRKSKEIIHTVRGTGYCLRM
jgi:DNA-binding response OmpR family regulator